MFKYYILNSNIIQFNYFRFYNFFIKNIFLYFIKFNKKTLNLVKNFLN